MTDTVLEKIDALEEQEARIKANYLNIPFINKQRELIEMQHDMILSRNKLINVYLGLLMFMGVTMVIESFLNH